MSRLLRRIVIPTLALVALVAVLALVLVPRLLGWVPLTILSGSMEPTIPVGSQVVVQPVEGEEEVAQLQVGDVISFLPRPDDPTIVTHRVLSKSVDSTGTSVLTQGDANDVPDDVVLTAQQIRGVVRYQVPYAGHVAQLLDGREKQVGTMLLAGGLLLYAAGQVALLVRDRRRAGDGPRDELTGQPEGEPEHDQASR